MASGISGKSWICRVTDPPSPLGFGRVIRQSLRLGETRRLVPVSSPNRDSTGRYGFRKSGKSWIWPGHRSSVAARIWACDTSIASSRRDKTIGTGFKPESGFPPEDMASGNPENPGFGRVTDPPSPLGFGRVIRQSLRLGETRRLVPVSSPNRDST
ncbi:hypothetical protein DdX_14708 [Ditylenchus destructor]|uniref:Uncharacterized protein n=1 Tax=Ditylenchus destructor TaxID=166010 RepID=A0AAD4MTK7_9BILA|nr:hypothetical protein DdX_14708 [Ditylenchus destructor]